MVFADNNLIQFGNGDVAIRISIAGTRNEPQAVLVFQNQAPTAIRAYQEGDDLRPTKRHINPQEDIIFAFSNPESIDSVISVLNAVKQATFGENNLVSIYIRDSSDGDPA